MPPANSKPKLYAYGREHKKNYTYVPSFTLNCSSKMAFGIYKKKKKKTFYKNWLPNKKVLATLLLVIP